MSEILTPVALQRLVAGTYRDRILAHDAALRARAEKAEAENTSLSELLTGRMNEIARLRAAISEIAVETPFQVEFRGAFNIVCRWCGENEGNHEPFCPTAIARKALDHK